MTTGFVELVGRSGTGCCKCCIATRRSARLSTVNPKQLRVPDPQDDMGIESLKTVVMTCEGFYGADQQFG